VAASDLTVGPDAGYLGHALGQAAGPFVVQDGPVLRVRWPYGKIPHARLFGATGGGKSTLLRVLVWYLLTRPAPPILCLADGIPDADSFKLFTGQPGVAGIASGGDATAEMAADVYGKYRQRLTDLGRARQEALATRARPRFLEPRPLFFLVDEYLLWVLNYCPGDIRSQVIDWFLEIGLNGRKVNVYLLLALQRCGVSDAKAGLPGPLKAALKCCIAATGEVGLDGWEATLGFDDAKVADRVHLMEGGGYIKAGGAEVAFKVPWFPDTTDPKHAGRMTDAEIATWWAMLPRSREEAASAARELAGART
jgi:hypothetical protein